LLIAGAEFCVVKLGEKRLERQKYGVLLKKLGFFHVYGSGRY
jgi:hypothetical protein